MKQKYVPVKIELLREIEAVLRAGGHNVKAAKLKRLIGDNQPATLSEGVQQIKDQLNARRYELLRDGARREFIVVRDRQCHLQAEIMDQAIDKLLEKENDR